MSGLSVIYWNCASGIIKKLDYMKRIIEQKKADLFFIAESEIPKGMDLGVFQIKGYDFILAGTLESRGKARLACYARKGLFQQTIVNPYNDLIFLTQKKLTFVGVYRGFKLHEGENERSNWLRLMNDLHLVNLSGEVFIVGDFNIDVGKSNAKLQDELKFWTDAHGLNICQQGVTRRRNVQGVLQESTLDLLLTNSDRFEMEYDFNEMSDHCVVSLRTQGFRKVNRSKSKITCINWDFDEDLAKAYLNDYLRTSPDMSSGV